MAFCQGLFLSCHVYGAPYSTQDYCGCHKIIKMMLKKTVCTNQFNSKVINILTSRLSLIIIKVNLFQEAKLKTLIWSSSLSCIGETANEKNVHLKSVALRSNKDDLYLKKKKKNYLGQFGSKSPMILQASFSSRAGHRFPPPTVIWVMIRDRRR